MKKLLSVILTVLLIFTAVPMGLFGITTSAENETSGTTGDCKWSFDENSLTLTISGNGKMADYSTNSYGTNPNTTPWRNFKICKINIEYGVTHIGNYSFINLNRFSTITFPDSLLSIGRGAFISTSLTSITIPTSVQNIENGAFCLCVLLRSVTVLNNSTIINDSVFSNCSWLTEINFPTGAMDISASAFTYSAFYNDESNWVNNALYIGNHLIYAKIDKPGKFTIKPNTIDIARGTFLNHTNLTDIIIPESVERISDNAFEGCINLTSITIPKKVKYIGISAFKSCAKLTNITIPNSVTKLGNSAFRDCIGLKNVHIQNGLKNIEDGVFRGCTGLESITIPDSIENIGYSFSDCSKLKFVNISDIAAWCNISFVSEKSNPLYYAEKLYLNNKEVTDLVIPDSVEKIGNYAFYNCTALKNITIPASVKSIGILSFNNCSELQSVDITDFSAWCKIDFASKESNPLYYAHRLYVNEKLKTDIEIPRNFSEIKQYSFINCESIKSVIIPDDITNVGKEAFFGCTGIEKVTINNVDSWCKINFSDLYSNPLYYGKKLYINDNLASEIILSEDITVVNTYAFYNCENIKTIILPRGLKQIKANAFYNCTGITDIFFPDTLKSIESYAFADCNIKEVWYCGSETDRSRISGERLNNAHWNYDSCGINKSNVYDNACDTVCNVCGHIRTVPHFYDNACDTTCNMCGYVRTVPDHVYDNACDTTCNICGYVRTVPDHVYDNACDTTCNICGYVRTVPDHVYDNACDTTCNICGYVRSVPDHVYDNACDTTCNICGYVRSVPDHVYDSVCDSDCNICGFKRNPPHEYSNACDISCNLCGYVRSVPDHVYDNACDTECNECGYKRVVPHKYKNDCSTVCELCGEGYRTIKHTYEKNPFWSYNNNEHWEKCYICNKITDKETHIYDNDSDPTCNICGYVRILDTGFYPDSAIEIRHLKTEPRGYTGIYDYSDLQKINENPSGKYILMQDIDLFTEDKILTSVISKEFTGIFNGNGYTISNLKIKNNPNSNAVSGLFYHNKGVICNLRINNPELYCITGNASAYAETGVIAAQNSGTIRNCFILNPNIQTFGGIHSVSGGIAGVNNSNGKIQYCTVSKQIDCAIVSYGLSDSCKSYSGGICGRNSGTISSCNNYVKTYANSENITYGGGIAAYNSGKIENSYSTGFVLWYKKAKTIYYASAVGYNDYSGKIENVYCNKDSLCLDNDKKETQRIILVYKNFGSIKNCYLENINIAGVDITVGSYGEKMTSAQMKNKDTYEGFDFDNVWIMGTYPELRSYNYSECVNGSNHSGGKATCQGQAVCEICGVYYGEKADHTYTEWQKAYGANCTKEGLKVHHCLYCGLEEKTQIAVNNKHIYIKGYDKCTLCGHKYTSVIGDTNGDEVINGKDVVYLCNYLANYDYETGKSTVDIFEGADANGDGEINGKDVIILCNYLANFDYETGKSTVELGKGSKRK